jgi:hypothetical protein
MQMNVRVDGDEFSEVHKKKLATKSTKITKRKFSFVVFVVFVANFLSCPNLSNSVWKAALG